MPKILLLLKILRIAILVIMVFGATQAAAQTSEPLLSYHRSAEKNQSPEPLQQTQLNRTPKKHPVEAANFETVENLSADMALPPADPRQLAPPSSFALSQSENAPTNPDGNLARPMPQLESLTTAGTGLALVVGLFLVCMWLMRRSGPKPSTPLPKEAVAVLGRVPLAASNFAHLLQVGNKLVLVALTPDGVTPITEVTDPQEVDRLLGLCLRNHKNSSTAEFQHVLQQLASEPATGFLGNESRTRPTSLRR